MSDMPLIAFENPRDVVLVEGADARSYLQSQLTQDIEAIPVGGSAWSFILDPKSSIQALVRVTRIGNARLTLDIEPGHGDAVRARLDDRLFRTDARFSQFDWPGVTLVGEGSTARKPEAPIVARSPWSTVEGLDVVGPNVTMDPEAVLGTPDEYEEMRIEAGWPMMASELTNGITPAMTGLVDLTVAFDKGCYTGQELVARTHHRGAAPTRRLVALRATEPIAAGAPIIVEGDEVGEVTSAAGTGSGLGYLIRKIDTPVRATVGSVAVDITGIARS